MTGRIAETAVGVMEAFMAVSKDGVVTDNGIIYPCANIVGLGLFVYFAGSNEWVGPAGRLIADVATPAVLNQITDAFAKDQVQVIINPGRAGFRILHHPRGNSFKEQAT